MISLTWVHRSWVSHMVIGSFGSPELSRVVTTWVNMAVCLGPVIALVAIDARVAGGSHGEGFAASAGMTGMTPAILVLMRKDTVMKLGGQA